jgi:Aspartyl protease
VIVALLAALAIGTANVPVATLPLVSNGMLTGVRATSGGRALNLVLDTGASTTVIDLATARELGLRVVGTRGISGAGKGKVRAETLAPVTIALGAAHFVSAAPLALDLSHAGTDRREDGLLGFDFFTRYAVDVDYDARTVTLYDARRFTYRGDGAAVPVEIRGHRAYLPVTVVARGVAPERQAVLLDLGSEDAIDSDVVLRSTAPKRAIQGGVGIGARFSAYLGTIDRLRIGNYELRDLPAATGGVQLVGSTVLRRFHAVYDLAHGRVYLRPRPSAPVKVLTP